MMKLSQEESLALQESHLTCLRNEQAIIKASGKGLRDYLQGQITQEVKRLTDRQAIYAATLTPQGKAISDLHIVAGHHNELLIIAGREHAVELVGRLRQFALGYELRIGMVDSLKLISLQGGGCDAQLSRHKLPIPAKQPLATALLAERELFVIRMPEAAADGVWIISDDASALLKKDAALVDERVIKAARIIKGVPTFGADWSEKVYPLNANLIEFDGVNFEKGCYVGQEVTSRMQWRGGIKKRLYRVQLESMPSALPCPVSTSVEIGAITSAAMHGSGEIFGIAHLPIETVENHAPLIDPEGDSVQVIEACHG